MSSILYVIIVRNYCTQCCHTYGVYLDSIPSLCLFPSVASFAGSRRSTAFACIIKIRAISGLL